MRSLILVFLHSFKIVDVTGSSVEVEIQAKLVSVAPETINDKLFDQPFVFRVHGELEKVTTQLARWTWRG